MRDAWNPLVTLDDPYPLYRRLRDEAPVYYHERLDLWALSRFDDVQAAAEDWETFSTSLGTYVTLGKMRGRIVRYHDTGIALEFVRPLNRAQLTEQLR